VQLLCVVERPSWVALLEHDHQRRYRRIQRLAQVGGAHWCFFDNNARIE
jgi:hypothetical protein